MAGFDIAKFMKSQKKKSFAALLITMGFCALHLLLWLCIAYKIGWHAPTLHRNGIPAHVAISQISTVGTISDSICIAASLITMFGLTRDYEGRLFLFVWVIFMVFYLIFEALLNSCFLYWSVENKQIKFVLISSVVFWLGRSFILAVCTIQVMARFYELIRIKEENQPPTIIVTGASGELQTVRNPAYKPTQRSVSITTVSSTMSNLSNPDEYCEKQYPGFLPMSVNYNNTYPYAIDEDMYDPQFLQYIINSFPENQPHSAGGVDGRITSPSYEEATSGPSLCPPAYNDQENLPPSYYEGDMNYNVSAQGTDNTHRSVLLRNQH